MKITLATNHYGVHVFAFGRSFPIYLCRRYYHWVPAESWRDGDALQRRVYRPWPQKPGFATIKPVRWYQRWSL